MTKDDDLIRRGDATKIANHLGFLDNPDSVAYAVSEAISAIPAVQPTVTPDVVEIDIRAVMMEQIEEAAAQSPWVPPEYAMNEVISDCCSFLREPRYPSPDVAALVEALEGLIQQTYDCEKELTEDLHHMDFCGESEPLTKARAILALIK